MQIGDPLVRLSALRVLPCQPEGHAVRAAAHGDADPLIPAKATGWAEPERLQDALADPALQRRGRSADHHRWDGMSVREEDQVKAAISAMGGQMVFDCVAVKPGKPVSLGRIGACHCLGLPGNPLSAFVTWHIFDMPLLHGRAGRQDLVQPPRHVVLSEALDIKLDRVELRPASLTGVDRLARETVAGASGLHSARITALHATDGLLYLPPDTDHLPQGALVEFLPFCE